MCERLRNVTTDQLQQVVLGRGVLLPHHQQVELSLLPVSPGEHDVDSVTCVEQVSVRLKTWCRGALTLAAEMEGCIVKSSQVSLYIPCCLPMQECVAPPLHHPGVHAHKLTYITIPQDNLHSIGRKK